MDIGLVDLAIVVVVTFGAGAVFGGIGVFAVVKKLQDQERPKRKTRISLFRTSQYLPGSPHSHHLLLKSNHCRKMLV